MLSNPRRRCSTFEPIVDPFDVTENEPRKDRERDKAENDDYSQDVHPLYFTPIFRKMQSRFIVSGVDGEESVIDQSGVADFYGEENDDFRRLRRVDQVQFL